MLLIAIVDDERSDSSALKALVDTYFQQNRQAYMIHVFNGALDFIRSTENHDIVFMDIRMDKLDGLEVARIMRKINTDSVLIFVTHMAQLAIKGYEVDALDFIVKPADQGSINYVLDKAMKRLEGVSNAAFALKTPTASSAYLPTILSMSKCLTTIWFITPPRGITTSAGGSPT